MSHVYVHIPFCDSICYYCDFCRIKNNESLKKEWKDTILEEIEKESISSISTLYFGGGTPSSLSIDEFKDISKPFIPYLKEDYEWTVECNPDSITLDKLKMYKECGVNRISLGVQTFDNEHLKQIGRTHTKEDIYTCIQNMKEVGITNISIDLIYGLPNQTLQDLEYNIECFLSLDIPHLSIYSLQIEENSVFGKRKLEPIDEDLEADMYECIKTKMLDANFSHYEISSYCKEGYYSKHNLSYWNDDDFIGLGCGASGRENGIRYDHTKNIKEYIQETNHKRWVDMNIEDQKFEAIMMALRTKFGLSIPKWDDKYKDHFINRYENVLKKYVPTYLEIKENSLACTEKGMEILNTILVDFL